MTVVHIEIEQSLRRAARDLVSVNDMVVGLTTLERIATGIDALCCPSIDYAEAGCILTGYDF
jgi:hypothetical protein